MCPVCVVNMTLIALGATSSGGLTAFAMNKFHKRKQTSRPEGEGVTYVSRVRSKHGADRGWRDIERRTNRLRDGEVL